MIELPFLAKLIEKVTEEPAFPQVPHLKVVIIFHKVRSPIRSKLPISGDKIGYEAFGSDL